MTARDRQLNWSGPQPSNDDEQVGNARPGLFPLTPVSDAPAVQTRANWSALLPDQDIPLIWEKRYGDEEHPRYRR